MRFLFNEWMHKFQRYGPQVLILSVFFGTLNTAQVYMRLFRRFISNVKDEYAYNKFMLNFEILALRLTCGFGIFHLFMFLAIDYWRVENYVHVIIYRVSAIFVLIVILALSYKEEISKTFYNALCLWFSTNFPLLFYLLDLKEGMPVFFLPNSICLFFYVFNACLGHSFRLKVGHTVILVATYVLYSKYWSPHSDVHILQVWNIGLNASMSLLIAYIVEWFKRFSFSQREKLLESNSKLDLALQSAEMGIWSWNLKTGKRTFDRKIIQLLGLDYNAFRGTAEEFFNIVHPDDRQELRNKLNEAIETKKSISPEYRVVWPDESIHYIKARAKVICDPQGVPVRLSGISWDISDQKKIEQELKDQDVALKQSESKFRQISETISDVFYLYNIVEKRYEFISQNCKEVLGAPQEFFYSGGKFTRTFVIEEDQEQMLKANELVDSGEPYEREFRIIRNGEIKWIREKSFPIKDESGIAIKNSGICTDITHIKLQEFQLVGQKVHLETLNNTKDKFFSIVAHDLKSPLNSLKAFTSLLIDHTDKLSKDEIINMGKQTQLAVDNTIKMADNLITWARLQMNDYEIQKKEIYFKEVVDDILPVYKRIAEKKGIDLSWSFDDNLTLFSDRDHIQFIIRNLINNAIKFTNREGAIKLSAGLTGNGLVKISVSDNGIGIPDEIKQKIFTLGKNQSSKGTAGEKGTGLGLMLCFEFTKLNGGTIEVESQVGKGTTFNVLFKSSPH